MKFLYRLFWLGYRIQQWLLKRFTPAGWAILVCLIATVFIGLDTKQTMAYQIFTFLLAVLVIAVIYSFYFPEHYEVQRSLPRFATVGSKLVYRIAIAYEGWRYINWRWNLTTADFRSTSHICTVLLRGILIYLLVTDVTHSSICKTRGLGDLGFWDWVTWGLGDLVTAVLLVSLSPRLLVSSSPRLPRSRAPRLPISPSPFHSS